MEKKLDDKKTLGTQLVEKVTKEANTGYAGPEAREVTKEWGKKFLKDLENIIQDPKYKKWNKIFIKVLAKKPIQTEFMVNVVYGITPVAPSPSFKNMLYSYERKSNKLKLEWVLPQANQMAEVMLKFEEGFDPFLIQCIKDFKAGTLIGQY